MTRRMRSMKILWRLWRLCTAERGYGFIWRRGEGERCQIIGGMDAEMQNFLW